MKPRQQFELRGAALDPKVPSTLLQGSLDAHHGTDQYLLRSMVLFGLLLAVDPVDQEICWSSRYSFMVTPRVEGRGKRPERHVFKAMHDEEKTEWLRLLQQKNGSRPAGAAAVVSAPQLTEREDDFEVEGVVSRLETYACLVSFRVQRKFIHLLNSPHEDYASLKSVVLGMVMASAAMPGHQMQPTKSERHLLGELAALRELDLGGSSSEDEMPGEATPLRRAGGGAAKASPAPPPSDDSEDDTPPAPSPEKISQTRAREQAAGVSGFLNARPVAPGLRVPPPLPKARGGRRSRTPAKPKRPQPSSAPPAPPPPAAPPPAPPPPPSLGELPTPSARLVPDAGELLLKKAALKRRQTVNRLAGASVTAARKEIAKESNSSDTGGGPGIRHRARRRMSVLLQESPVHQESMSAHQDWPFMTGEDLPVPGSLALR
eukprot:COSAG02_NODE_10172_length_2003_cov_1.709559_3_plen_432_part_00